MVEQTVDRIVEISDLEKEAKNFVPNQVGILKTQRKLPSLHYPKPPRSSFPLEQKSNICGDGVNH